MVVKIRNKRLRSKILKRCEFFSNRSLSLMKQGRIKEAKAVERLADKLYEKYYDRMYTIIYRGKKLKSYKDIPK